MPAGQVEDDFEKAHDQEDDDNAQADHRQPVALEAAPRVGPQAERLSRQHLAREGAADRHLQLALARGAL